MAQENKIQENDASVEAFLDAIPHEGKRADSYAVLRLMQAESGETPKMWGSSIIGFGRVHYKYESGREGDMPMIGFSPRAKNLSLYILTGFDDEALLGRLGKHKLGKSCLYINKLADVDMDVLRDLIRRTVAQMRSKEVHGRFGSA